jgi:uncharacterized membrane protein YdjX (TVP38/TMEM64 family)
MTAGVLFPQPFCTFLAEFSASIGAIIAFFMVRSALGEKAREKIFEFGGSRLENIAQRLKRNEILYLFLFRVVPIFPFWFMNTAPSIIGVKPQNFFLTTLFGIIPGSFEIHLF